MPRTCKCGKTHPIYNEPNETKPIFCFKCKTDTMVNVKSKKCKCGKTRPSYNEPNETKPICCSKCKTDTMIDVINKKCKCGKARPIYNEANETKPICCFKCKTDTMVNVISKKCKCGKAHPIYNEPNETKRICCSKCKTDTMIDVRNVQSKKRKKCKCGKAQPSFNKPNETTPICCSKCKTDTMINVKSKKRKVIDESSSKEDDLNDIDYRESQKKIKRESNEILYKESIDLSNDNPTIKTERIEPDEFDSTVAIKTEIIIHLSFDPDGLMSNMEDLTGNNQEPPSFEENDSLRTCPMCSFPVAINDNNRGCNRVICFRFNCNTEFCRYCKKISDKDSRHMRCDCQR